MNNFEQIKTYMSFSDRQKPMIAQSWLRVLIFAATYFCLLIILGLIIRMIFPDAFAAGNEKKNANFLFLMFFASSAIGIAWTWLFRKFIDRKTFESLGFDWAGNSSNAGAGFFLGILMLCVGTLILVATKNLHWTDFTFNGTSLFLSFGLMLMIAFAEEIVFRGYILNNLLEGTGKWMALVISSLLFAGFHMGNSAADVIPYRKHLFSLAFVGSKLYLH
jgi:membrane protease YdiL (CAAX protease family)